ncbi:acylneuraminate cytidylyltransferase family protein [Paenibacillus sp. P2(2022)]|uniref:acylneuraminate cytidylyltransferase family protein n=1 Tax=Paenibacillus TaxID=44249 RepID=UPI0005ECA1FC|nr:MULTISPECIES: acylneuraminate cytidylyltransferase family protein [Paenibacillus]AUS28881.1 Posttranslational flagellin modification protein B [Paenibacillus polymyxa]KAE8559453.1 flagellar modification protein B [Paenibacillus polymyxa]KJK29945.1 flagellar modification protein B [Paenibacillus polymyxa]MCJ1221722.1 acylneuraminate cytidylyltransferase family protein [Paenibacillus polymyxa]MDG0054437.1 acylneuraminate cytidylyltransferase family protein [Paenibacillus sp. P2(2022)]
MGNPNCLAVIPARSGSKGLPGKNIRLLHEKPLIQYSIEAALNSGCVDEVVVTTDSEDIARVSSQAGAAVPFIRPAELATDVAKSIDVLKHAVEFYEQTKNQYFDVIMLLQPTSPLRNALDIKEAYTLFLNNQADSLQSVNLSGEQPYLLREMDNGKLTAYLKDEREHLRRQDLKELYALNGAIYIVKRDLLMNSDTLVGPHNCGYIMPRERSVDIDDEFDLKMAEFFWRESNNK